LALTSGPDLAQTASQVSLEFVNFFMCNPERQENHIISGSFHSYRSMDLFIFIKRKITVKVTEFIHNAEQPIRVIRFPDQSNGDLLQQGD